LFNDDGELFPSGFEEASASAKRKDSQFLDDVKMKKEEEVGSSRS
jgi:hypothetical protein